MTDGPLIVQSDKTLLLEVDHPDSDQARRDIAVFAELERAPEHIHTYRITPLGLWNARAAGHDAESVVDTLIRYSRFPVPHALLVDVAETMDRYGRLRLLKHPVHGLVLESTDRAVLTEVLRSRKVTPMVGARIDDDTVAVHPSERGRHQGGAAAPGLAGRGPRRVRRRRGPSDRAASRTTGSCATTSARLPRASGTADPGLSSCPAARARPSWARPRWTWPRRRR